MREIQKSKTLKKEDVPELVALRPLFELQEQLSHVPRKNELLIEHIETEDGFHLFVYPFEGRLVHGISCRLSVVSCQLSIYSVQI